MQPQERLVLSSASARLRFVIILSALVVFWVAAAAIATYWEDFPLTPLMVIFVIGSVIGVAAWLAATVQLIGDARHLVRNHALPELWAQARRVKLGSLPALILLAIISFLTVVVLGMVGFVVLPAFVFALAWLISLPTSTHTIAALLVARRLGLIGGVALVAGIIAQCIPIVAIVSTFAMAGLLREPPGPATAH